MPLKIQSGMKFGDWEVIERDYNPTSKQHSTFWFCKCGLCGKVYSVSRDSLVKGKSGCCNHCKGIKIQEIAKEKGCTIYKCENGMRFGLLTVIGNTFTKNRHRYAHCHCDCGNELDVRVEHLVGAHHSKTISCGCSTESSGEIKIRKILEENNINFQAQYRIRDFNIAAPFDFALFDDNNKLIGLLEYDGQQHFIPVELFGGEERMIKQQERDNRKNDWCKENNIRLKRIPYTDYDIVDLRYLLSIFPELADKSKN